MEEWLEETVAETRIEELSDEEILSLAESKFDDGRQQTFSRLLEAKSEGSIDAAGRLHLATLMQNYESGLLRKSRALRVAVERGLIVPLAE